MTLDELESENATLKANEETRRRAFQIVITQVKTGLGELSGIVETLPDGDEKTKALALVKRLEAKAAALLAADYDGAMKAVQPEPETAPAQAVTEAAPVLHTASLEPEQQVAPETISQVPKTETE